MTLKKRSSEEVGRALAGRIEGQVFSDEKTLNRFATDQSIYEIRPLVVVVPRNVADVIAVLAFAREENIPITARGGGSNTAGSALGRGIVLSFNRTGPMNRILDFRETKNGPHVVVEPGLLHDELQAYLRERGLYLPADPSSGNMSMLGGNIATKASGPHAFKHGSIDRYLEHVQFVTMNGEVVDTSREETIPDYIRKGVESLGREILADKAVRDRLNARKDRKLASGYNLFTFVRHDRIGNHVAQLLVGSVGTLGIVTQATLRAEPYVEGKAAMLLYFRSLDEAGEFVQHIKDVGVAAIEIINHNSIVMVKERNPGIEAPEGEAHMLMVEFEGPERFEQIARVKDAVRKGNYHLVWEPITLEGEEEQSRLWKVRKALLPTVRGYRPGYKPLSVVNDVGVEETHLADFIRDVEAVFARHDLVAAIYGHAGSGNLHLRPLFDVSAPDLPALIKRVADEVYEVVFRYDGTITAEHGMGRIRTTYLAREWGESIIGYMRRVKGLFDSHNILNPEVMFSDRELTADMKPV